VAYIGAEHIQSIFWYNADEDLAVFDGDHTFVRVRRKSNLVSGLPRFENLVEVL
jgi:hypothetical protein